MPDAATLLLFMGASAALLCLPGPTVIYVVVQSLDQGRRAAMSAVLGVGTSTFGFTLIAASAVLTKPTVASDIGLAVVRYLGAAYLIYLGVRKLLERGDSEEPISTPRTRNYLGGMIIQTLNPKIAIFFLAILPQFVRHRATRWLFKYSSLARFSRSLPCSATAAMSCWQELSVAGCAAAHAPSGDLPC